LIIRWRKRGLSKLGHQRSQIWPMTREWAMKFPLQPLLLLRRHMSPMLHFLCISKSILILGNNERRSKTWWRSSSNWKLTSLSLMLFGKSHPMPNFLRTYSLKSAELGIIFLRKSFSPSKSALSSSTIFLQSSRTLVHLPFLAS
jgi:hypothetical protein